MLICILKGVLRDLIISLTLLKYMKTKEELYISHNFIKLGQTILDVSLYDDRDFMNIKSLTSNLVSHAPTHDFSEPLKVY